MEIKEISNIYSALPQCGAFLKALSDKSMRHIFLKGMYASSASVFFAVAATVWRVSCTSLVRLIRSYS